MTFRPDEIAGFAYHGQLGTIDVSGYHMSQSRKYRNIIHNAKVALWSMTFPLEHLGACAVWRSVGRPYLRSLRRRGALRGTSWIPRSFGSPSVGSSVSASTTPIRIRTCSLRTIATCKTYRISFAVSAEREPITFSGAAARA